jgi:superfamily II DNA or RNA helicase
MHRVDSVIRDSGLQARPYQRRVCSKAVNKFRGEFVHEQTGDRETAVSSIMIESPTGSGKTCMAMTLSKALQIDDPDLTIGWVAMRRNLLVQAARENQDKNINVQNIHFISMFDKNPHELVQAKRQGKRILLVVDEAQHDAASSMSHLHNTVEPDWILGMTATPFRTDRMKLCFQSVIKDVGIHQLIQDGFLSPYHHYTIPSWTPKDVADHYCADPKRWGKSIFFFVNLKECDELAEIFRERGVNHEVVRGGQPKTTEAQLERFESGETNCLINCMVLTEGFDCPSLKTAWVRPSGRGPTMQMGGRAFRIHEDLSFKQIVQSKQTRWPFIRTAMPAQQLSWQSDSWRSLTVNPRLNDINANARMAIAHTEVNLPKYISDRKDSRGPRRIRF